MSNSENDNFLLLDDFSKDSSQLHTQWEGFTDQVMGGVSEQSVFRLSEGNEFYIRMSGDVSLDNNGGFIQIRLPLAGTFQTFDGSDYKGIRLKIRGKGNGYYIFIRTTRTILPWKFYKSKIPMSEEWDTVFLPWESFEEGDYGFLVDFNPAKIKNLALVAYAEAFRAEVDLTEIGLYK